MSRAFIQIVGVALLALALPAVVLAQSGATRISGVVKDSSGAPVPGAVVKVINEGSNAAIELVTDAQGAYATEALTPAAYRVEVVLDGFGSAVRRVALTAGQPSAVDVTLEPARLTEGVVVSARRVEEVAQEVPIPLSVLSGEQVANAGSFAG